MANTLNFRPTNELHSLAWKQRCNAAPRKRAGVRSKSGNLGKQWKTWESLDRENFKRWVGLEKIEDSAIDPIWVLGKFIHASGWPSAFPKQFIKDFSIVSSFIRNQQTLGP